MIIQSQFVLSLFWLAALSPLTSAVVQEDDCPKKPLELCIALDESGSICATAQSATCNRCDCRADELPLPGDLCCDNYKMATEFAVDLINSFRTEVDDEFEVGLAYFSTRVNNLNPSLMSPDDAIADLEAHTYRGGWTYTGGAFAACHDMLDNGSGAQKVVVLVTDGNPTVFYDEFDGGVCSNDPTQDSCESVEGSYCYDLANDCADNQAMAIKDNIDDATIVAIGVGDVRESALDTWASTPDLGIAVADFDALETVLVSLITPRECAEPPQPTDSPTSQMCFEFDSYDFERDAVALDGWVDGGVDARWKMHDDFGGVLVIEDDQEESYMEKQLIALPSSGCEVLETTFNYCTSIDDGVAKWEPSDYFQLIHRFRISGSESFAAPSLDQISTYRGDGETACGYGEQKVRITVPDGADAVWVRFEGHMSAEDEKAYIQDLGLVCCTINSQSPSASPSATPSKSPSAEPSASPSTKPSATPSFSPSSSPSSAPSSKPSTSPSATPSKMPSAVPSASPSAKPSASPSVAPSSVPSASPSSKPSAAPSVSPSSSPSAMPTCKLLDVPVEVCFAIDESGSICNGGSGSCNSCSCIEDAPDYCCDNFRAATDFAVNLVDAYNGRVADFKAAVSYFSTRVNSPGAALMDAQDVITDLNSHTYRGGWTYTGGAFAACKDILMDGKQNAQKFIILLTDGDPTVFHEQSSGGVCLESDTVDSCESTRGECNALSEQCSFDQASAATDAGIEVIPIGIGGDVAQDNLMQWASSGTYFDVPNFDDLEDVFVSLLKVSECAIEGQFEPTPAPTERYCLEDLEAYDFDESDGGWVDGGADARHISNMLDTNKGAWLIERSGAGSFFEKADIMIPSNTLRVEAVFNFCTSVAGDARLSRWETKDVFFFKVFFSTDGGETYQSLDYDNLFTYQGLEEERCGYDAVTEIIEVPSGATHFMARFEGGMSVEAEKAYITDISFSFCGAESIFDQPSSAPTGLSEVPSATPSGKPSTSPSSAPSSKPSVQPSSMPSHSPSSEPSSKPSATPSVSPSKSPSAGPSASPSAKPSAKPSSLPSQSPSSAPSAKPSASPSATPSGLPSANPSSSPSASPLAKPSASPSAEPSSSPSVSPSSKPSSSPSVSPSSKPSVSPSSKPSSSPSVSPSAKPSVSPSSKPSSSPSVSPSAKPSATPSEVPTSLPSVSPSAKPSATPSVAPTSLPSVSPTNSPSCEVKPQPVEICVAIDESGSICGNPSCTNCDCMTEPNPFGGLCCENYALATDFTAKLIEGYAQRVEDLQVGVTYFSSYVSNPQAELTTPEAAIADLESHVYKGGWTYTGGAFDACREMLMKGKASSTKFIFLITDGNPTVSWEQLAGGECQESAVVDGRCANGGDCKEPALDCATYNAQLAKDAGIDVIPIGIGDVDEANLMAWKTNLYYQADNFEELQKEVFSALLEGSACEIDFRDVPTQAPTADNCDANSEVSFAFDADEEGWVSTGPGWTDLTEDKYYTQWASNQGGSLQLRGDGEDFSFAEKVDITLPENCPYLRTEFNYCTTVGTSGWESSDHFLIKHFFAADGATDYQDLTTDHVFKYTGMLEEECAYETQTVRMPVPSDASRLKVRIEANQSSRFERVWIQDISFTCCGN